MTEKNVVITIGNSDDKLPQLEWSGFCGLVHGAVINWSTEVHGVFYSLPHTQYQNAAWSFVTTEKMEPALRARLHELAGLYGQDSIAWMEGKVEFLEPKR